MTSATLDASSGAHVRDDDSDALLSLKFCFFASDTCLLFSVSAATLNTVDFCASCFFARGEPGSTGAA